MTASRDKKEKIVSLSEGHADGCTWRAEGLLDARES